MSDRFAALVAEARATGLPVSVPPDVVVELLMSPAAQAFCRDMDRLVRGAGVGADELEHIKAALLALGGECADA